MPVLPKEDTDGIRTRSQRQQEMDQRRFGDSPSQPSGPRQPTLDPVAGPSGALPAPAVDLSALLALMQEQTRKQEEQARRQEEQARRQEEQARLLREQLQKDKEEQARKQEEQAHLLREQLQKDKEEQARKQEEQTRQLQEQLQRGKDDQMHFLKDVQATFGKELKDVKEQVKQHDCWISETKVEISDIKKTLGDLKAGNGIVAPVVGGSTMPSLRGFKVPPFDGTSSWSAYKIQFEAVMKSNGWDKSQAMTALTLCLRDQALTVLEALGNDRTYDQLLEALDSRYGDAHLEYVFRAQLKDRVQRSTESLQQWAVEIEKLVRKANQSTPAYIDGNLVQAFVDGIRDLEVRAAVNLGHHRTLKDALAHALEVEAVRQDHRAHRVREVVLPTCHLCGEKGHYQAGCPKRSEGRREGVGSPRCYICGEKGHLRANCPKGTSWRDKGQSVKVKAVSSTTEEQQGNE